MKRFSETFVFQNLYKHLPSLLLLISVLNEFDFNYLNLEYFSFNFPYILIFFFTLKEFKNFDYFLVFLAGLINDTVVGLPLGISILSYILISLSVLSFINNISVLSMSLFVCSGSLSDLK